MEDSKADLFLIREALAAAGIDSVLHVVHDGQQAVQYIEAASSGAIASPCPDLVLLDLNLPKKGGIEVLRDIRKSRTCRNSLVLIVTSSDSTSDREAVKALGYDGYFRKPSDYEGFLKLGAIVKDLLARAGGSPS